MITLYPFVCSIIIRIKLNDHAAVSWLPPRQLFELDWAEADIFVLHKYYDQLDIMAHEF